MGKPITTTSQLSRGGEAETWFRVPREPIQTVIRWQAAATVAASGGAAYVWGLHGLVSAVLGGSISICAALIFLAVAARGTPRSPEAGLYVALKAQAAKVGFMIVSLLLVLMVYQSVVVLVLVGTFLVTVVIFSLALFVRGA